jgi:outer membrane lipoprotein-sorting protein
MKKLLFSIAILFTISSFGQDAVTITKDMISTCKNIKTLQFDIDRKERINGKYVTDKNFNKISESSSNKMVYVKQYSPKEGIEVLYKQAESPKALVNPNIMLMPSISLDPYGSQMRENQHHTIHKAGLKYTTDMLDYLYKKYNSQVSEMVKITGSTNFDGRDCYIIKMTNPNYKYEKYTVKSGEDLVKIANARKLSEYLILEKNDLDDYDDVDAGDVITISNDYASGMEIYVDKTRKIPLIVRVYDEKGMVGEYKYTKVKVNPTFTANDFSKDNDDYDF